MGVPPPKKMSSPRPPAARLVRHVRQQRGLPLAYVGAFAHMAVEVAIGALARQNGQWI
jgi:hypothetical protein